ncbi:hypothetical protein CVT24_004874 [Panaeolus cyanescens]|uniref:Uncharacterized protein n=1 Tax=Panaeolus cyanescens TaxID=181874 RepID=A0A409VEI6_9AGAR|nr:hypothetical protein CVT24_004874 [Panaeolus cyanescens]
MIMNTRAVIISLCLFAIGAIATPIASSSSTAFDSSSSGAEASSSQSGSSGTVNPTRPVPPGVDPVFLVS